MVCKYVTVCAKKLNRAGLCLAALKPPRQIPARSSYLAVKVILSEAMCDGRPAGGGGGNVKCGGLQGGGFILRQGKIR